MERHLIERAKTINPNQAGLFVDWYGQEGGGEGILLPSLISVWMVHVIWNLVCR